MNPATILTMANGKGIDLFDPKPEDIDFAVIAEHLAKTKRYNGATPGREYSVAQHSVLCANAALDATGDRTLAAYCLLHDGHEAYLGDDTTPKKMLIAQICEGFGVLKEHVLSAFDLAPYRFDHAIHTAAGLQWPPSSGLQAAIKRYDMILFKTEWRDLMENWPLPNAPRYVSFDPVPWRVEPLEWEAAQFLFMRWCRDLLPALQAKTAEPS